MVCIEISKVDGMVFIKFRLDEEWRELRVVVWSSFADLRCANKWWYLARQETNIYNLKNKIKIWLKCMQVNKDTFKAVHLLFSILLMWFDWKSELPREQKNIRKENKQ